MRDQFRVRLAAALAAGANPRRLTTMVGRVCVRRDANKIREAAAAFAAADAPADPFAAGYRVALRDILATADNEILAMDEAATAIAKTITDTERTILKALADGPRPQGNLGVSKTAASRTLPRMRARSLVMEWPPLDPDRRKRWHRLTPKGEKVLRLIGDPQDSGSSLRVEASLREEIRHTSREYAVEKAARSRLQEELNDLVISDCFAATG